MAVVEVLIPWLYKKSGMLKNVAATDEELI